MPILLYPDGAVEGALWEHATCGALLLHPRLPSALVFGSKIPPKIVELWNQGKAKQVLGEAELLPVLIAKTIWASAFQDEQAIIFIDNYSLGRDD